MSTQNYKATRISKSITLKQYQIKQNTIGVTCSVNYHYNMYLQITTEHQLFIGPELININVPLTQNKLHTTRFIVNCKNQ